MKKIITFIALLLFCLCGHAQTERWDAMMAQAKAYSQQKEYAKAIECNEELIADLESHGVTELTESIRNGNAINYIHLAVPLLEQGNYAESKEHLDKALANAKPQGKVYFLVQSYMGLWHSKQAQTIMLKNNANIEEALALCNKAEQHFAMANKPESVLNERISRVGMLRTLSRMDEAVQLCWSVIDETKANPQWDIIRGKALSHLGDIERKTENFEQALAHLEEAYNLCLKATDKSWAYLSANRLYVLFLNDIHDEEKAMVWKQRKDELEASIEKDI